MTATGRTEIGTTPWSDRASLWIARIVFALAVYLLASTIFMVVKSWIPLPFWDQWNNLVSTRVVSWAWLVSQNNEHRILFPRLIFWADRWLAHETNAVDLAASVIMQGGLATLMALLAIGMLPRREAVPIWVTGIVGSFLFWAVQHENFTWGFQVPFFGVLLAAVATFMCVAARVHTWRGAVAAILCETVALYTLASGILVPVLAVGVAIWVGRPRPHLALLALAAIALPAFYLVGYHAPQQHTDPFQILSNFPDVALHSLVQIGGPFAVAAGQPAPRIAASIGAAGLALFLIISQQVLRGAAKRQEVVLVAICAFVLCAAALTAAGRVRFGMEQALSSRYATPVLLFWLAVFFLFASRLRSPGQIPLTVYVVSIPVLLLMAWSQPRFAVTAILLAKQRSLATPALLSNVADPRLGLASPDPSAPLQDREALLQARTTVFADDWTRLLGSPFGAHFAVSNDANCSGTFLKAVALDAAGTTWSAVGRASFATPINALTRLVLTDAHERIVGYGLGGFNAMLAGQIAQDAAGRDSDWWIGDFSGSDAESVNAYALQANGHDACPLLQARQVERGRSVIAAPLPADRLQPGGSIDAIRWEPMKVTLLGWGFLTDDSSRLHVETDLPIRAMKLKPVPRPDVINASRNHQLANAGFALELDLAVDIGRSGNPHLCVWTSDAEYGQRILPIPADPGLCPEAPGQ
jgi:hypothetical protein